MTETLLLPDETVRPLDADHTRRLLQRAAYLRMPIRWHGTADDGAISGGGILVAQDAEELVVEVDAWTIMAVPRTVVLRAILEVSGTTCVFETRFTGRREGDAQETVRLLAPATAGRVERRRSRRRRLRATDTITLRPIEPSGDWHEQAAMLNLSVDGIACRLPDQAAARLSLEHVVSAQFDVGAPNGPFGLTARVVNLTQAGTSGQTVVGMEFVQDAKLQEARFHLQRVLATPV